MSFAVDPPLVTAAELFAAADDGNRYELIEGRLQMMSPAGGRHGRVAFQVALQLRTHVRDASLGVVLAAATGFRIAADPDTVLAAEFFSLRGTQT